MTDRDLLTLLRNIDNDVLLYACQRCDEGFLFRITSQFSSTAKKYFYEDMERVGHIGDDEISMAREKIGLIWDQLIFECKFKDWNSNYSA